MHRALEAGEPGARHDFAHARFTRLGAEREAHFADAALPQLLRGELNVSRFGGGGEQTHFVCGCLACEAGLIRLVLAGLPRLVRVHVRSDGAGQWLESSITYAVERATAAVPGSDAILARLAEVLFAETLQRHVQQLPDGRTGWLAGANDAAVGRGLAALHRRPEHPWSLEELAAKAGVSRSVLTERFAKYPGQSPIAYLADWRIELGADALRSTSRSVLQIAAGVGYESEAAFNRAFKRRFGKPPDQYQRWRRGARCIGGNSPGARDEPYLGLRPGTCRGGWRAGPGHPVPMLRCPWRP